MRSSFFFHMSISWTNTGRHFFSRSHTGLSLHASVFFDISDTTGEEWCKRPSNTNSFTERFIFSSRRSTLNRRPRAIERIYCHKGISFSVFFSLFLSLLLSVSSKRTFAYMGNVISCRYTCLATESGVNF